MTREPNRCVEDPPKRDEPRFEDVDRVARQPYAGEVDDYAGEKSTPPQESGARPDASARKSRRRS